jgi:hypothetical protein
MTEKRSRDSRPATDLQVHDRRPGRYTPAVVACRRGDTRPEKRRGVLMLAQDDQPSSSRIAQLPEAYTVAGALAASGIGKTKLYEELNSGRLKSFVLCGRRLIMREDLLNWLRTARDVA